MRTTFFRRFRLIALGLLLSAVAAPPAAADDDLFVPPGMLKGKPIPPDDHPDQPVLFVFTFTGPDRDAQKQVQPTLYKLNAAHSRIAKAGVRVVVVGSGVGATDTAQFAVQSRVNQLDILSDPLGLMNAQCGTGISKDNPLALRMWGTDGKLAPVIDVESFLGELAKKKGDEKEAGTATPPTVPIPAEPDQRLREKYALLAKGRPALALSRFRQTAGNKGLDPKLLAEAQGMVDALEKTLDERLAAFRSNTADHWLNDYQTAQQMAKDWQDDRRSRDKIEAFIKEWGVKKDIQDELAARKMRLKLWMAMRQETAPLPHHPLLHDGFEALVKDYPDSPSGKQAKRLLQWIPK